jgi:2-iminobutanoate/2-iminopropanoate deaminase
MTRGAVSSPDAPRAVGPYSQAVVSGDHVFLSGQTPIDPGTGALVEGDIGEQTKRCLENLAIVAAAAGASLDDAVRCGIFVTDISVFSQVNEAYGSYFGDAPPARTTIGVASLPLGAEVEIDAILAIPD